MSARFCVSFLFFFLISFAGFAQLPDCTLGLGSVDAQTMIDIFQLNGPQQATLKELRDKLQTDTEGMEAQVKKLFEEHPQETQEELMTLAQKYKDLQQQMVAISTESDRQLLKTFNERQYERYIDLCREALRNPIEVVPTVYDTESEPE